MFSPRTTDESFSRNATPKLNVTQEWLLPFDSSGSSKVCRKLYEPNLSLPFEKVYLKSPFSVSLSSLHVTQSFHLVKQRKWQEAFLFFCLLCISTLLVINIYYWSLGDTVLLPSLSVLLLFVIVRWERNKN